MKNMIIEAAPAKINLFLDICSKRSDGYHNIISVMQSVSLCDTIYIKANNAGRGINISCDNPSVPLRQDNLAYRAAEKFLRAAGLDCGLDIEIQKNIPMAAGLGGGSSDAAAVLRGLNKMFDSPFSTYGLCRIGLMLGADVPFCVIGGCAEVKGIGEIIDKQPVMPQAEILISCAGVGVSTPGAYARLDGMFNDFKGHTCNTGYMIMEAAAAAGDVFGVCGNVYNIFEECILKEHREAAEIKRIISECGADACLMSGSGPSVFGIFTRHESASSAKAALAEKGFETYLCGPATAANQ